ncbi:unnamed protein product [Ranitomeya imitator]|uniref:Uncharacterized protein n=1 Tax=Ranitomeya imitator TaxID=111125 RepID=A0ABN9KMP7_9NEOB|nr:unnamed protein product [Ranitomeya imitator]
MNLFPPSSPWLSVMGGALNGDSGQMGAKALSLSIEETLSGQMFPDCLCIMPLFMRSNLSPSKSCYQKDFVQFSGTKPDRIQRRYFLKRMEGLPGHHLLSHHGEPGSGHLVSHYDDHYIRRGNSTLPPLRSWDRNCLTWAPEKSDFPSTGKRKILQPILGFCKKSKKNWRKQISEEPRSVYSASYRQPPPSALITVRYGVAPRILSSTVHQPNNTNKALDFKCQTYLQVPDDLLVCNFVCVTVSVGGIAFVMGQHSLIRV